MERKDEKEPEMAVISCTGWAADESTKRRGFLEDIRLGCELGVSAVFDAVRYIVRRILALPANSKAAPRQPDAINRRRTRSEDLAPANGVALLSP